MSDEEYSNYEDLKACMQCAQLAESLQPCEGDCGRELCPYCQPKCKECVDHETVKQIREEKREKERLKKEAEKKGFQPERSLGEKIERAMDWVFGFADGALKRELQYYEGEFEDHSFEDIQEMMKARWKHLPEWKKQIYKAKKKTENFALKTVYKVGAKGGHIIGQLGRPGGPSPDYSTLKSEEDKPDFEDNDLNDEDWNDDEQDTEKDIVDEEDEEDEDK